MPTTINGRPVTGPVGPLLLGGLMTLLGLVFVAHTGWQIVQTGGPNGSLFFGVFGAVMVFFGARIMVQGIRMSVSKLAFRQAELVFSAPSFPIGGKVTATLTLDPKRSLALKGGTLTVKTIEYARYQAGTDSRTYTDTLFSATQTLTLPEHLWKRLDHKLELDLPMDIPPTWEGKHNRFYTTVELTVDIDNWPDLLLVRPVIVRPEVAA